MQSFIRHSSLLLLLALVTPAGWSQPEQVILIRHAEKPDDPDALHLSPRGRERAQALVKFFTENRKATRYGPPVALYATQPTRRGRGQRPKETLEPLAKQLRLPILTPFESEGYEKLARQILAEKKYQGKTVVVCWVHEYLPELAAAFRVTPEPPKWKDKVYDRAWIITFTDGKGVLDTVNQKLLPGDSKMEE